MKPSILYCSVTWISCCRQDNFGKIFKLQKRCARIILDDQKYHSSVHVDLFKTLGRMPYYVETDIKRRLIAYKRISGACSDYRNDLLERKKFIIEIHVGHCFVEIQRHVLM